jgi:hypothetical protein
MMMGLEESRSAVRQTLDVQSNLAVVGFPGTIVLILTALEEPTKLSDSLKAGAAGYILKRASAAQITDAVRRVLAGQSPLDEELAMLLLMCLRFCAQSIVHPGGRFAQEPGGDRGRTLGKKMGQMEDVRPGPPCYVRRVGLGEVTSLGVSPLLDASPGP